MLSGTASKPIDEVTDELEAVFARTAEATLLVYTALPLQPWISSATLRLIEQRNAARRCCNAIEEASVNKLIRRRARLDREEWLNNLVASGEWSSIRFLYRTKVPCHGKLRNLAGELVESSQRADTFAQYLAGVHWAAPATAIAAGKPPIFQQLDVFLGTPTQLEVTLAAHKLKCGKACGPDGVPVEYWKVLLNEKGLGAAFLTKLVCMCWEGKSIPAKWHHFNVALLFKKGSVEACSNYRPISLLNAAYKVFSMILLMRLKRAGAEDRLWSTQFGFRSKRSTLDALFVVRKNIEQAWATRNGKLILLALDWARAFDSITPSALITALQRCGIPEVMIQIIQRTNTDGVFTVSAGGERS